MTEYEKNSTRSVVAERPERKPQTKTKPKEIREHIAKIYGYSTREAIMKELDISERTYFQALKDLEEEGWSKTTPKAELMKFDSRAQWMWKRATSIAMNSKNDRDVISALNTMNKCLEIAVKIPQELGVLPMPMSRNVNLDVGVDMREKYKDLFVPKGTAPKLGDIYGR